MYFLHWLTLDFTSLKTLPLYDRRPRRRRWSAVEKNAKKPRRPDIILLFSCLPGGLLSNTINFIPSYYRPAASDSVCVYNNIIYLSQQNRITVRVIIFSCTLVPLNIYCICMYIHLYNIDCANIGYFLYNPFTRVDNIMKFFVFFCLYFPQPFLFAQNKSLRRTSCRLRYYYRNIFVVVVVVIAIVVIGRFFFLGKSNKKIIIAIMIIDIIWPAILFLYPVINKNGRYPLSWGWIKRRNATVAFVERCRRPINPEQYNLIS